MKRTKLAAAAIIMTLLTACGGNSAPAAEPAPAPAETAAQTAAETTSAAAQEETSKPAEETVQEASQASENLYTFNGSCYSFTVDTTKWMDAMMYLDQVSQIAENETDLNISADQIKEMCETMYLYLPEMSTNFNFTSSQVGEMQLDPAAFGPAIQQEYEAVGSITFLGWEAAEINGYSALKVDVLMDSMGSQMKMSQYMFWEKGYQIVATYTSTPDYYDTAFGDFKEMIDTISFN